MRMQTIAVAASEIGEITHSVFWGKKCILDLVSLVLRLPKWEHD